MRNGTKGFEDNVVDLTEALELTVSEPEVPNRCYNQREEPPVPKKTPSSWLGSCRFKLPDLDGTCSAQNPQQISLSTSRLMRSSRNTR